MAPQLPTTRLVADREADEWKAAYILNKQKLPDKPPTLNEVVRLVARLGGLSGTKRRR